MHMSCQWYLYVNGTDTHRQIALKLATERSSQSSSCRSLRNSGRPQRFKLIDQTVKATKVAVISTVMQLSVMKEATEGRVRKVNHAHVNASASAHTVSMRMRRNARLCAVIGVRSSASQVLYRRLRRGSLLRKAAHASQLSVAGTASLACTVGAAATFVVQNQ